MEAMSSSLDTTNYILLADKLYQFAIRCYINVYNRVKTNDKKRVLNEFGRLKMCNEPDNQGFERIGWIAPIGEVRIYIS